MKAVNKKGNMQIPRRHLHQRAKRWLNDPRAFNYSLDFSRLNFRIHPEYYRVGRGEEGVLLVEPYKSEILPHWRFKTRPIAKRSADSIFKLFLRYKDGEDFIGMDMTRKFLQMGYTRSRRYANHRSGQKYSKQFEVLPMDYDAEKSDCAEIFFRAWSAVETDLIYADLKLYWKLAFG